VNERLPNEDGIEVKVKSLLGFFDRSPRRELKNTQGKGSITRPIAVSWRILLQIRIQPLENLCEFQIATVPFVTGTYRRARTSPVGFFAATARLPFSTNMRGLKNLQLIQTVLIL